MSKIKILIVDDSAVVRQAMTEILSSDPAIGVVGAARDPTWPWRGLKTYSLM